jgi:hypothetical protein
MGISVSIIAGPDQAHSSVQASGSISHIITDTERQTFGVTDGPLKNAVGAYFGKNPNDAYLHSPTPWNDLYKTYGWPQVQTVLVVDSATITGITSNPEIIKSTKFTNSSGKSATFNVAVSDSVSNTVETNWSETSTVDFTQSINYSVGVEGVASVGGETSISFSQSFGLGGSKSETVTVGSDQGVSVELGPGESVTANLSVSRGTMKVRIVYKAYLTGDTAVNYDPTYKDHHFWGLDIGAVMNAGHIKNSQTYTEDISIGYYSNAEVTLQDSQKQMVKASAATA